MVATPMIVIVGPTASGKSALAIELAQKFDGEIICADSRTVYKYVDIGTAKPSPDERALVTHHLLDIVEPDQPFTAADFKKLATQAIVNIHSRGKLPILVGGSGLYVDAILYDYRFSDKDSLRNPKNIRHLDASVARRHSKIRKNTLVIGISITKDELKKRIAQRVEGMVSKGLVQETEYLMARFPKSKALHSTSYKAIIQYLRGEVSLDEAKALFASNDVQLAKRQMTWFKRNNSIQWLSNGDEIVAITTTFLSKITD